MTDPHPDVDPAGSAVVLCGGVGAAKLLRGMVHVVDPASITAVVNTADDTVLHGLHISPDLDTVTYTLAGQDDTERGWGLRGETWQAMEMVRRYGGIDWFNLGDRDLGTHLYRTHRLSEGATLSQVTAEITAAWDIGIAVVPVTDDRIETRVTVPELGEIGFQEYFVRLRHDVDVSAVRFDGADAATPAPGVIDAVNAAATVVIAPSNPVVSVAPLLAIRELREAVLARRDATVAVSPIVGGAALKGPAAQLMRDLGIEASALGVARHYLDLAATIVIDQVDAALAPAIEALGMACVVTDTIMADTDRAAALSRVVLGAASPSTGAPS
ncbi:MAG: 2-phospho-L-lactate transferase [Acidimicrobiales bacterium]